MKTLILTIDPTLTDPLAVEKIRRYWTRSEDGWTYRLKDLVDVATPSTAKLHAFAALYSSVQIEGLICATPNCGKPFRLVRRTDSDRVFMIPAEHRFCGECANKREMEFQRIQAEQYEAERRVEQARCEAESKAREDQAARVRKAVEEACSGYVELSVLEQLDVRLTAALLGLLEFRGKQPNTVGPLIARDHPVRFSPALPWGRKLLAELIAAHVIAPQWAEGLFDADGSLVAVEQVIWQVRIDPAVDLSALRRSIIEKLRSAWTAADGPSPQLKSFMRELCSWEAIGFLLAMFGERGMGDFNPGEGTIQVVDTALDHFTLGQVWCLMYQGAAHAGDQISQGVSRRHAANKGIARMDSRLMNAVANKITLRPFTRNSSLMPLSAVSRLAFVEICHANDDSFGPELWANGRP